MSYFEKVQNQPSKGPDSNRGSPAEYPGCSMTQHKPEYIGCFKIMSAFSWEKITYSENVANCSNNLLNGLNLYTIVFNSREPTFNSAVYWLAFPL